MSTFGPLFGFVDGQLIPHLRGLKDRSNISARQKIIGEIMSGVECGRTDGEHKLLDLLDRVHEINATEVDQAHLFMLCQVYDGPLVENRIYEIAPADLASEEHTLALAGSARVGAAHVAEAIQYRPRRQG